MSARGAEIQAKSEGTAAKDVWGLGWGGAGACISWHPFHREAPGSNSQCTPGRKRPTVCAWPMGGVLCNGYTLERTAVTTTCHHYNIIFYGSIADLQCCVNSCCAAKWLSHFGGGVQSLSCVRLFCDPTDCSHHAPCPGKNTGVGCHFLLRGSS